MTAENFFFYSKASFTSFPLPLHFMHISFNGICGTEAKWSSRLHAQSHEVQMSSTFA